MRLKISASSERAVFIPVNYQYQLHGSIYNLIQQSNRQYADFLHNTGFSADRTSMKKYKLFTFSRLKFFPFKFRGNGFYGVRRIEFVFSTAAEKNYEHLVYGLFSGGSMELNFSENHCRFTVEQVESRREPSFEDRMKMLCLSPIAVSTSREKGDGNGLEAHFLDYLNPAEKDKFCENIQHNLIHKYETLYRRKFEGDRKFLFRFDPDYLVERQGKISKLIHFKNDIRIKAFKAPFTIEADPELIKIGYQCGFGEKNSAGFGCVELVRTQKDAEGL
ncbi:MAG: CRISPR-associated endoribonuclease Cas6 [Candidatus Marinimicrobia bacterium]|nr:CRISPR-associated endoribonuclease Cas6 [Candidatus Neomarinimicrobiota bacterium]